MTPRLLRPALALLTAAFLLTGCITNRSFGDGLDDTSADANLKTALLGDKSHDYADVDITVFEGRLLLTGTMRTLVGKQHVGRLAANTENVTEVINELVVGKKTSFGQGAKDALLDERISAKFLADSDIIGGNYKVTVSKGVVYLLGLAQSAEELKEATDWARGTSGVTKVVSHVLYVGDSRRGARQ
ncbi:MAG: BON domain-containing protein [Parvularculaceae bacterium]